MKMMQSLGPESLEILLLIHDRECVPATEIRQRFGTTGLDTAMRLMHELGYLQHAIMLVSKQDAFVLSAKGRDCIGAYLCSKEEAEHERTQQEHQETLKEQAQNKRWRKDARRSWVQFAITTAISLASFFIGAIVQVLTGFLDWMQHFFH